MAKKQTDSGKALEYCFASEYYNHLLSLGLNVTLLEDIHFVKTQNSFNSFTTIEQNQYLIAAQSTISSMLKIEPALLNQISVADNLEISIAADAAGKAGDVRDIIFKRNNWQIGFSVKNNHDAAKHSRLSSNINFGNDWLGYSCSSNYFNDVNVIFNSLRSDMATNSLYKWSAYPNKETSIYLPILNAFRKELLALNGTCPFVPKKLLSYLIGRNSFYKIIKRDTYNLVVVKGYNMNKDLGRAYNGNSSVCGIPSIQYPTRIIEFELNGSNTTLFMTLDKGWQISFRIHSADKYLQDSLKFDISLIGNPPILFTHYMF